MKILKNLILIYPRYREKKNLEPWVEQEINKIMKLLINEAKEANALPLKYKIFVYYIHIYYLPTILRLKSAGFNPIEIKSKKSFFHNVKLYIRSVPLSLKLFRIEFL